MLLLLGMDALVSMQSAQEGMSSLAGQGKLQGFGVGCLKTSLCSSLQPGKSSKCQIQQIVKK